MIIGSHVSFSKDEQLVKSVKEALSYNANALMLYTGAPQNTNRYPIREDLLNEAKKIMDENNFDSNNIIVHAPYIINPANPLNRDFNINFLKQEISRVESLGLNKLVLHPGSHVNNGIDKGIESIVDVLKNSIAGSNVMVLLETMAGKGSEVGSKLEEIKRIIDEVNLPNLMVCIDTCHLNDAGYDMSSFSEYLDYFDSIIGIDKIKCVHVNDSKNIKSSHKDRHENIGFGTIGFDNLIKVVYNERLKDIPKILETPYITKDDNSKDKAYPPYKFEIEMIKEKKFNPNMIEQVRSYYI